MLQPASKFITPEEYLAQEEKSEQKHEYRDGEIVALAGTSLNHNQITLNLTAELMPRLRGKPCRVFSTDIRLRVEKANLYTYPDVIVICGKIEFDSRQKDTVINPLVIFEVWSDSTRAYDRSEKFAMYRKIPSLQEYVMIDQEQPNIEHYRRDGHFWVLETLDELKAKLNLSSIDVEIPLETVYSQVEWKEKPKRRKRSK